MFSLSFSKPLNCLARRFTTTWNAYKKQKLPLEQELLDYLDYYNNRRIKAKLKGLPSAIHRQQALSPA